MLTAIEFCEVANLVYAASNGELPEGLDEVQMMVIFGKLSQVLYRLEPPYDAVSIMPTSTRGKRSADSFVSEPFYFGEVE